MELLVLVGPLPVDALGRGAQVDAEHAVDRPDDLGLLSPGGLGAARGGCLAHRLRALAELVAQDRVHPGGVGRALRFRHHCLRHEAVLGDDRGKHVPLATVAGHRLQQECHGPVIAVAVGGLDDGLEKVVGSLDLVPEHGVVLGELEVLEAGLAHDAHAQKVEAGEQPAAAAAFLVRDLPVVQMGGQRVVDAVDDLAVNRDVVDSDPGDRVLSEPVDRVGREVLAQQFQVGLCQLRIHPASPCPVSVTPFTVPALRESGMASFDREHG